MNSDQVSKCYEHPAYNEDACVDCEMNQAYEVEKVKLTSKESVLAEVLREKLTKGCADSEDELVKFTAIGWVLQSDEEIIKSFNRANHNINEMAL